MISFLRHKIWFFILGLFAVLWCCVPFINSVEAKSLQFERDFSSHLKGMVVSSQKVKVDSKQTLRQNIVNMFYPRAGSDASVIYVVIRDITLWLMIVFFVWAGASLLLNRKPENAKKHLYSLLYIMLWWVFVYGANRLFWDVFHFNADQFTVQVENETGIGAFTNTVIWRVFFVVLSAIKAAAFFLAIIMTAITGFRVMAAWDGEKWKKLVKWLINVVAALLVIKWIDFIYYLAADSSNFVQNASNFIINVAKVFGWLYWIVTVIMVIVAWYLYITDGWSWSNFKKASNLLINIMLSALVLFGFLLIVYQIFAEFQPWWDAVTSEESGGQITFLMADKYYV